jgi:hypothetical protein
MLHARRRRTVLITSGNLVITVLKYSRKDSYDQVCAERRQALMAAALRGRLPGADRRD